MRIAANVKTIIEGPYSSGFRLYNDFYNIQHQCICNVIRDPLVAIEEWENSIVLIRENIFILAVLGWNPSVLVTFAQLLSVLHRSRVANNRCSHRDWLLLELGYVQRPTPTLVNTVIMVSDTVDAHERSNIGWSRLFCCCLCRNLTIIACCSSLKILVHPSCPDQIRKKETVYRWYWSWRSELLATSIIVGRVTWKSSHSFLTRKHWSCLIPLWWRMRFD